MPNVSSNYSLTIGGITSSSTKTFQVDAVVQNSPNETIPAYVSSTLTTRTNDTEGIVTATAHGIADTATVSLVWSGGYRYDVDIDSVTTDTITFSGGTGDNLPLTSTVIFVCKALQIDFNVNGTNLYAISCGGTQRTISSFLDDSGTPVTVFKTDMSANEKFNWYNGNGYANPLTGNVITAVNVYNVAATTGTYQLVAGYQNTLDQV